MWYVWPWRSIFIINSLNFHPLVCFNDFNERTSLNLYYCHGISDRWFKVWPLFLRMVATCWLPWSTWQSPSEAHFNRWAVEIGRRWPLEPPKDIQIFDDLCLSIALEEIGTVPRHSGWGIERIISPLSYPLSIYELSWHMVHEQWSNMLPCCTIFGMAINQPIRVYTHTK